MALCYYTPQDVNQRVGKSGTSETGGCASVTPQNREPVGLGNLPKPKSQLVSR